MRAEWAVKFETEKVNDDDLNSQKNWFFGNSDNPMEFKFNDGDLLLIRQIVKFVVSIVDQPRENANTIHFKREKNAFVKGQKNKHSHDRIYQTLFGHAYGYEIEKVDIEREKTRKNVTEKELSDALFQGAKSELEKYISDTFKPEREITQDNITNVKIDFDLRKATGAIICCFCENHVAVFSKSIDSLNWTFSNLATHMSRWHEEEYKRLKTSESPKKKRKIQNNAESNQDQIFKKNVSDQMAEQVKTVRISCGIDDPIGSDEDIDFKVLATSNESQCLFIALCHQLHQNTADKEILKLRKEISNYIKTNIKSYEQIMQSRIEQMRKDKKTFKVTSRSFAANYLSKNDIFGGIETVKAVSDKYRVNIITIDDGGTVIPPIFFDKTFGRMLLICFRGDSHYQSVVNASPSFIASISNQLFEEFKKKTTAGSSLLLS